MNVLVHHLVHLFFVLYPFVLDNVRQSPKNIKSVSHAAGYDLVYFFVLGPVINQIQHIHRLSRLADPFDPA